MRDNNDNNFQNRALVAQGQNPQYLPSTEVREVIPEFNDEIDLRDLIDTLIRRKGVVLSGLLLCFTAVALYTFMVTPQFKAMGVLRVSSQSDNLTKFENVETTALKTMEFQQTQVKLLQSEQLASRVISRMDLMTNPVFNPKSKAGSGEAQAQGLFDTIKGFIRPDNTDDTLKLLSEEAQELIVVDQSLDRFGKLFTVSPVRNSELIEVSFTTTSPSLAAEVTNTAMDEFINMAMASKLKSSQDAGKFLGKQIEQAQIKLEKSELELQAFAKKIGIVSLDPKQNLVMRQLEELNQALAEARAKRIVLEAKYQKHLDPQNGNLFESINNELIQSLKRKYADLLAEYQNLSTTFKPAYPKMVQLKAQMTEIEEHIQAEKNAIFESIRDEYETALQAEEYLTSRTEEQKQRALALEEKATQYKIYEREVATNKSIYQSLLERSKEIEATLGASVTNIQIVDAARAPLYPFKPRVALNLAIGLVLGLVSGVGAAFLFEYFDNTIKNPDEMRDRFGIPVLGLIPYDKESVNDRKKMALKFYTDPRSPVAEAFRTTMTSVRLSVADNPPKTARVHSLPTHASPISPTTSAACLSMWICESQACTMCSRRAAAARGSLLS